MRFRFSWCMSSSFLGCRELVSFPVLFFTSSAASFAQRIKIQFFQKEQQVDRPCLPKLQMDFPPQLRVTQRRQSSQRHFFSTATPSVSRLKHLLRFYFAAFVPVAIPEHIFGHQVPTVTLVLRRNRQQCFKRPWSCSLSPPCVCLDWRNNASAIKCSRISHVTNSQHQICHFVCWNGENESCIIPFSKKICAMTLKMTGCSISTFLSISEYPFIKTHDESSEIIGWRITTNH